MFGENNSRPAWLDTEGTASDKLGEPESPIQRYSTTRDRRTVTRIALLMPSRAHAYELLNAARQLDEAPFTRQELAAQAKRKAAAKPGPTVRDGESVMDTYNHAKTMESHLIALGYRIKDNRALRPVQYCVQCHVVHRQLRMPGIDSEDCPDCGHHGKNCHWLPREAGR